MIPLALTSLNQKIHFTTDNERSCHVGRCAITTDLQPGRVVETPRRGVSTHVVWIAVQTYVTYKKLLDPWDLNLENV